MIIVHYSSNKANTNIDYLSKSIRHLYVHIPFCPSKCGYCAFVNHVGSLKLMEPYLQALATEGKRVAENRPGGPLETVYFGGGTPSLMTPEQVQWVLSTVDQQFEMASGCEITLECHPATVDSHILEGYRRAGITRLSFGAESLHDSELRHLGRTHSATQVIETAHRARAAGFQSLNIDLMYGIPHQTVDSWARTLEHVLEVSPDHLSLYPLSIEPKTVFSRRWREHMLEVPDDDEVTAMYQVACNQLREAKFEHYEVANWSTAGHRSRHNLAYWRNEEFYALGVGAHSYQHPYRAENVRHTKSYIDLVQKGKSPVLDTVFIDEDTRFTETVMLGMRLLTDGLHLPEILARTGVDMQRTFAQDIRDLSESGLLEVCGDRVFLPETAVPVANEVWERFVL